MPTYKCKDIPEITVDLMPDGKVGASFGRDVEFNIEFPIEELLAEWIEEDRFYFAEPTQEDIDHLPAVIAALRATADKLQEYCDDWKKHGPIETHYQIAGIDNEDEEDEDEFEPVNDDEPVN
jgi:hypothetical protein